VDHAAEEESGHGRADPGPERPPLREPRRPPDHDEGPPARLPLRHAGGQGAVLRQRRHAGGDRRRPAAAPPLPRLRHAAHARGRRRPRAGRGSGGPRLRPAARRRMSGARARALVALLALVTACGRVGPPVAPERRLPLPPAALSATVRAGEIVLSWQNPTHRADHSRLRDVEVVRLYRTSDAGQREATPPALAGDQVVGYERLAVIRLERPGPAAAAARPGRLLGRSACTRRRPCAYL